MLLALDSRLRVVKLCGESVPQNSIARIALQPQILLRLALQHKLRQLLTAQLGCLQTLLILHLFPDHRLSISRLQRGEEWCQSLLDLHLIDLALHGLADGQLAALEEGFGAEHEEDEGEVDDEDGTGRDLLVEVREAVMCRHEDVAVFVGHDLVTERLLIVVKPGSHAAVEQGCDSQ